MTTTAQAPKQVKIGEYVLTGKIGQGGIAEIYRGRQESLNRDVAIKILSAELSNEPDIVRRFELESMVIARLNHPNIVHVIDKGQAGNRYYFVMEYVDGTSMREVIDSDKISLKVKLEMIAQVCKALDYAHKNGVIHRDIKPANILIDRQGNPRVADFGIAQIVGRAESDMTAADVVMGTVAYMSPEQKVSSTNVDQTTDIYAIGIIIYEILVGKKPLGRFKMPSELNPELNASFDAIIEKCLAEDPAGRYQTAVELKDALFEAIGSLDSDHREPAQDFSLSGSNSFIGKCRHLDTIQETRHSSTILVEHKVTKQLYVIKKHSKGEAGRKEAKLLTTFKHKNILNIFGSGGTGRNTVVVCEYAQGGSLADRMVRKYDWRPAMELIAQVASGLDFAHKNNIIHGNIRPSNILFDKDETPKITDFGMPIHYDSPNKKNWYSPPEHKQSRQGDIYGLGVILHRMITGRSPQYDTGDNLRLDDVKLLVPEEVRRMLAKLLAIRVTYRYKTGEEFLADWDGFVEQEEAARRQRELRAQTPKVEKKKLPGWMIPAAAGGGLVLLIVILWLVGAFG
ncbi:MAG: protein kinase [candidate division Zixibacteria bacterium]|jgi:serine/threonine-protein kinase|nr:protein kinase [candidate division Zixibacteria bacterium]